MVNPPEGGHDIIAPAMLTPFLPPGGAGRGVPARRAGATPVTSALGAEDGWGNPAPGPGPRQRGVTRVRVKADATTVNPAEAGLYADGPREGGRYDGQSG